VQSADTLGTCEAAVPNRQLASIWSQAHTSTVAPKHNDANAMQDNTTRLKAVRLEVNPSFCCAKWQALSSSGANARAAAILATCKYAHLCRVKQDIPHNLLLRQLQ